MKDKVKKVTKKQWMAIGVLALAVITVFVVVFARNAKKQKENVVEEKVYPVQVMEAGETGNHVVLTYTGMVSPDTTTQCTFETIGTVRSVFVKVGDQVTKGQPLVELEDENAQDELKNAQEQLTYASDTLTTAQKRYDQAKVDYEKACGAETEKQNLDDAIKRRDEQQAKVDGIKEELKAIGSATPPIDNTEYYAKQLELQAAQDTLSVYEQNVTSAQEAYDTKQKEGVNSNEAKAQKERLDAAEDNVNTSQRAYENAQENVNTAQKAVEACVLTAPDNGYVVDVQATEGSVSTPILPAVVLASHEVVINFGISQTDVNDISVGTQTEVIVEERSFQGQIKDIHVVPDENTRTYAVNVSFDMADRQFHLGELATVKIDIGERKGIWVPLAVILNDGNDYVYVVENGRAKREYIQIEEINNDQVLITGTKAGDLIICEGMKTIRTGSKVSYDEKKEQQGE